MKRIFVLFTLLLPALSFSSEKIKTVKELVELYQDESLRVNGHYISVLFDSEPRFQANAKIYEDRSIIKFYASMVSEMTALELASIACHELGHLLGEIRHANIIGGGVREFREAIEGEADYFGGSCLKNFISLRQEKAPEILAAEVAASAYQKLLNQKKPIRPALAKRKEIIGILPAYPEPECRLLTVLHGIGGTERPKCWYNP